MLLKCLLALTALMGVANAQLTGPNLVFSEVLFKPSGGARFAFVELYNPTGNAVVTSDYKLCNAGGICTQLGGTLNADSYYVICTDISTDAFCRMATSIQIQDMTQLLLFKGDTQVDLVSVMGTPPTGQSYTRGLNPNNLLSFSFSTLITSGIGFLGGQTTTDSPSATPISVPGISYLGLNEISTASNNRFIEIAFASTTSIGDYLVTFYAADGSVLSTSPLSDFSVGTGNNGMIFATLNYSHSNSQIGVALTGDGFVWDFVSKGVTIKASGGAADGATSELLGTSNIYQQRGSGCSLNTFNWVSSGSSTKGSVNQNQFPTCEISVFINEVSYNQGSGNYLEVAYTEGLSGSDLGAYVVEFYVQATGQPFLAFSLDEFTAGATSNGLTFASISLDVGTRRLLRRLDSLIFDGFALTNIVTGEVIAFFSVTGTSFTANGGGANGAQANTFPINSSAGRIFGGFTGTGCDGDDFAFGASGLTRGAVNSGQSISCSSDSSVSTDVLTAAPTTMAPTPAPTPFPTAPPTENTNECSTGEATCHAFASCTDTPTGFTCTCLPGFTGNGFSCIDINECVVDTPCATAANGGFCVDEDGSFKCGCLDGWIGDGITCTDVNECTSNPCGPNSSCSNTQGSFQCNCNSGFSGNAFDATNGCSDTNECSSNPCGANAFCTNTVGGFVCACNTGFTGNGITCSDTNECSSNPCNSNANCQNTAGGFTCTCNSGFSGDGFSCNAITTPSPTPAPNATPSPTTQSPESSDKPSALPTITNMPSFSFGPSITSNPSAVPSLSDAPSGTNPPSDSPSLSLAPSITDMPSNVPSLSDSPTT